MSRTIIAKDSTLKRIVLFVLVAVSLYGCRSEKPVRIGLVTGTSGQVADMGINTRYGIQLAVDQCNAKGGIQGRRVEIIVKDGQENVEAVIHDVKELIAQKVDAMIGPMSSTMSMPVVPILNEARMVTVSPSATTSLLSGLDDYFFRVVPVTSTSARVSADYQIRSGNMRRVAVAYHASNPSFCEPFVEDFKKVLTAGGGNILSVIKFTVNDRRSFSRIADELLREKPDGILIIANAMDSAMLCQQIRKVSPSVKLTMSNWSEGPRLIELGGKAVEGATIVTGMIWDSKHPRYQNYRKIFMDRYGYETGSISVYAYNAAQVVLTALNIRKRGQSLKNAILAYGEFNGLQGKISLDAYGDMKQGVSMLIIRNQKFTSLE